MTKHLDRLMVSFLTLISLFFFLPVIIYRLASNPDSVETWLKATRLALIWFNIMLVSNLRFRAFFSSHKAYIINNILALVTLSAYIILNIIEISTTIATHGLTDATNITVIMGLLLAIHLLITSNIIKKMIVMTRFKSTPCDFNPLGIFYQNSKSTICYYFDGENGKWSKSKSTSITSPPKETLLNFCIKKIEKKENMHLPKPASNIEETSPYRVIIDYCLSEGYRLSEDEKKLEFVANLT
ncbi:MAG: hypothetical protein JXR63_09130 [Spirochaetales bacterium]|nr:hypothetical protein [Spirochaetales bacterium]